MRLIKDRLVLIDRLIEHGRVHLRQPPVVIAVLWEYLAIIIPHRQHDAQLHLLYEHFITVQLPVF